MSEQWGFYLIPDNERPRSIALDMGLAENAPLETFPVVGNIRLFLNAPSELGLSTDTEFDRLAEIEDRLNGMLCSQGQAVFVGRDTGNGFREFYYYVKNGIEFGKAAKIAMAQFPNYRFETGAAPDEDWNTYFKTLYPSPRSQQMMGNYQVLTLLASHGDDHEIPRRIDHHADFTDKKNLQAFVAYIKPQGFTVRKTYREKLWGGKYMIDFDRIDAPAQIDDVALPLWAKIVELNGVYDGWGCGVETGSEVRENTPGS